MGVSSLTFSPHSFLELLRRMCFGITALLHTDVTSSSVEFCPQKKSIANAATKFPVIPYLSNIKSSQLFVPP